jgi:DNA-binding CsgD family transcriptional regulator
LLNRPYLVGKRSFEWRYRKIGDQFDRIGDVDWLVRAAKAKIDPTGAESLQHEARKAAPGIEKYWAGLGSKSKMARRLEVEDQVFGLICIDDTDAVRGWDGADFGYFDQFITEFFSPIIRAQVRLEKPSILAQLSTAEISVVRLAACGLTYKEVARRLGKSPNTVDNQLRSARAKLKVRNQVELAQACLKWL